MYFRKRLGQALAGVGVLASFVYLAYITRPATIETQVSEQDEQEKGRQETSRGNIGANPAHVGVFKVTIQPIDTPINTATEVTVTAEIGTDPAHPPLPASIMVYETDAAGKPIKAISQMYDDGTHGDVTAADTIFTTQFGVNDPVEKTRYYRVSAAYSGLRNRYLSSVVTFEVIDPIPLATLEEAQDTFVWLQSAFDGYVTTMDYDSAKQRVYEDAIGNPNITTAEFRGSYLYLLYQGRVPGGVSVADPSNPTQGGGERADAPWR